MVLFDHVSTLSKSTSILQMNSILMLQKTFVFGVYSKLSTPKIAEIVMKLADGGLNGINITLIYMAKVSSTISVLKYFLTTLLLVLHTYNVQRFYHFMDLIK